MSLWDTYKDSSANPINFFAREDPAKEANKYLGQIPGMGRDAYNPFIEGGRDAGGILKGEYGRNISDPTALIDQIMQKYSMSKGAQYQQDKLGKGIGATAAAGGIAGTPEHQTQYGEMANDIMSKDMQQYLMTALGIHAGGIAGEEGFYNKGYDANKELTDLLGGNLASQGTLAFQGSQQKNASRDAFTNSLMKALAQGAGAGGL